jgi:RNA polymerase sigma factor (sigma-70 family)
MEANNGNMDSYRSRVNAVAKIFEEHADFIFEVIRRKSRDELQANDLFQDFFLSLIARPVPRGVQNIRGYLYKAIINDIVDAARRVDRYHNLVRKYAQACGNGIEWGPEGNLVKAEETEKMFELIERRLKYREAHAVTLRFKKSYEINQIAREMGVDNRSVRRFIFRGLNKIRDYVKVR